MRNSALQILLFSITCFLSLSPGADLYANNRVDILSTHSSPSKFESATAGSNRARRFETGSSVGDPAMVTESFSLPTARYHNQRSFDQLEERNGRAGYYTQAAGNLSKYSVVRASGPLISEQSMMFPDHHFW